MNVITNNQYILHNQSIVMALYLGHQMEKTKDLYVALHISKISAHI